MGFLFGRRRDYDAEYSVLENIDPNGGKVYRTISTIAIVGLFATVGLAVCAFSGSIKISANITGLIIALTILCAAAMLALPWIRRIELNEYKKLAYVFLGIIGFCAVLWIIADVLVISAYKGIKHSIVTDTDMSEAFVRRILHSVNYIKFSIILSLQFSVASFVANYIVKYKSKMLAFQIISYLSYLVFDVWLVVFMFAININPSATPEKIFSINESLMKGLLSRGSITILVISVLYIAIANGVIRGMERKRVKGERQKTVTSFFGVPTLSDLVGNDAKNEEVEPATNESVNIPEKASSDPQERLSKLKSMLDGGLITQEEYDAKRSEILKDI